MKKVFLDTNIFIDFFDESRINNEQAKQLIYFLISNEIKIVFSEDMISTIAYLIDKDKLPALMSFFKNTITNPYFDIVSFGSSVINMACDFYLQNKGDFEDYLQYFCAEKENCTAIYTMDKNFPNLKIPIKRYGDTNI